MNLNEPRTAQVGAPLKFQKSKSFLNMQKNIKFAAPNEYAKGSKTIFFLQLETAKTYLVHQKTKS